MHSLAKKLALARYTNQGDPFRKDEFPSLRDIAIDVVALNFNLFPQLEGIPTAEKQIIISKTSTNWKELPTQITAPHISDESYWKRSCEARWKNSQKTINLEDHGKSWKVAYLEKHLEDFLGNLKNEENKDFATYEVELKNKIKIELSAIRNWVHTLTITHMKIPLDIALICEHLPLLTNLTITYGMKNPGMDYTRQCLGIKLGEAANLAPAIEKSFNLLSLSLPANMIDDDLSKFIIGGVSHNISLIELNLSHNKLGVESARRLAKFLIRNEVLQYLDISNNQIGYDGSRYLAQALKKNSTLSHLNMRLNNLDDKAGTKFFKDLVQNRGLIELNISGNGFGYHTAQKVADYLANHQCKMQALYIGNNNFGNDCFDHLKKGLSDNMSLAKCDIRGCKFAMPRDKDGQIKIDYKQSEKERYLTELTLNKYYVNVKKWHFVFEEEYYEKKLKWEAEQQAQEKLQEAQKQEKNKDN